MVELKSVKQVVFVVGLALSAGAETELLPGKAVCASALSGAAPTQQVLVFDLDGDGKPDLLERWWNGKRVRWLDENRDMTATDTRGDMLGDVLQVDVDGDGAYDGVKDINIRWVDRDHAYWLKETLLRVCLARIARERRDRGGRTEALDALETELVRAAYLGDWPAAAAAVGRVPAR